MDIDVAQLAAQTAAILAPFLPYLLKGGKAAAKAAFERVGEKFVDETWEQAEKLWKKIWPKAKKKEAAKEAVEDMLKEPDDKGALASWEYQLKKMLSEDSTLIEFTQTIVAGDQSLVTGRDMIESVAVKGDRNLVASHGGRITQTTKIYHATPAAKDDKAQKAFHLYLEKLRRHCNSLPLAALGGEDADEDITLDKVYIDLDTTQFKDMEHAGQGRRKKEFANEPEKTPISVMEVAAETERLVLLGDAGAGKSSFVKYLIARQAALLLGESKKPLPGFDRDLTPVLLVLRDLSPKLAALDLDKYPGEEQKQVLSDAILEKVVADITASKAGDSIPILQEAFENGKILLVFDGLDEVPQDLRGRVRQAVGALIQLQKIERVIITSRSRSYTGQAVFQNFQSVTIAPFNDKKISGFAHAWYNERYHLGRINAAESKKRADDLARTAATPEMKKMAGNPMMLTSIAIIHQKDIGLPNERVRLYSLLVEVLVSRWQKHKTGEGEFAPSPALSKFLKDDDRLRPTLEILAYETHRAIKKAGKNKTEEADLSRGDALTLLEQKQYLGSVDLASEFLDYVDQRSGLLVGRGGDLEHPTSYSFPHRTIQEYLAGCYLIGSRDRGREYFKHAAEGDFWSLAVLMGAEELYYNHKSTRDTLLDLIYNLCPDCLPRDEQAERALLWSGQFACMFGSENIGSDTGNPSGGKAYLERLIPRTLQLLDSKFLAPVERASAGDTLARLSDPRFDAEHWHLPKESLLGFVHIPAGEFTMGTKKKDIEGLVEKYKGDKEWFEREVEQHTVRLPDYFIAKYPVTVAQFKVFAEESGYKKMNEASLQGIPNHPVRYVTWFDAVAYCKWLNEKLKLAAPHQKGRNESEQNFWNGIQDSKLIASLPSEAEWEKAARGRDGREFPWEGDFEQNNVNNNMVIGNTSAVGCFPQGQSPYGLLDMSGNVWEWTRSIYEKYPYKPGQKRENLDDEKSARVLRGGAFGNVVRGARCASRSGDGPGGEWYGGGFRVVVASPPISLGSRSGS